MGVVAVKVFLYPLVVLPAYPFHLSVITGTGRAMRGRKGEVVPFQIAGQVITLLRPANNEHDHISLFRV